MVNQLEQVDVAPNFKLLVGLGNPTREYERTRHNVGFRFLDAVAATFRASFAQEPGFHGELARTEIRGEPVYLLKPLTYMNRSGLAVGTVARYFRVVPSAILVAHDDLDLQPGIARLKFDGGHGGHNGLRDIAVHLGTTAFHRLRFGIGHPGNRSAVIRYVLETPTQTQDQLVSQAIERAVQLLPELTAGRLDAAMKALHTKLPAPEKSV